MSQTIEEIAQEILEQAHDELYYEDVVKALKKIAKQAKEEGFKTYGDWRRYGEKKGYVRKEEDIRNDERERILKGLPKRMEVKRYKDHECFSGQEWNLCLGDVKKSINNPKTS